MRKIILTAILIALITGFAAAQPPTPGTVDQDSSSEERIPVPDESINENFTENTLDTNSTELQQEESSETEKDSGNEKGFFDGLISFFSSIF